jgi:hypothetical protein
MLESKTSTFAVEKLIAPRGAGIAGVIFAVLTIIAIVIVRLVMGTESMAGTPGTWLTQPFERSAFRIALQLLTFAGIAFLWLMGVLRNRLGALEDQLFATVFLGSGLLFVSSLFCASAVIGALETTMTNGALRNDDVYWLARYTTRALLNVFAVKMAAAFTFSTCTIGLRTAILPRWIIYCGFACGLVLLLIVTNWEWIIILFPIWILLVSVHILTSDLRSKPEPV